MDIYTSWMAKHGKAFNGLGEKERRCEIFKDNLRFIDEHNRQNRTYKVGLNSFADLTNEEYRAIYLGTRTDPKRRITKSKNPSQRYAFRASEKLPASVDWRVKGAINPIKNQGSCGKQTFCLQNQMGNQKLENHSCYDHFWVFDFFFEYIAMTLDHNIRFTHDLHH